MIIVLSPAKSLDYESPLPTKKHSEPAFLDDSEALIEELRELSPPKVQKLMGISPQLADLNFGRYLNWQRPFTPDNSRPAVLAFKGDVYQGLEAETFKAKDFDYAQKHLRILSGLYGVLRPLDLMQPYRLEMGTKFANTRGKNLYEFWGDQITEAINEDLAKDKSGVLVNLASNEYFKAINKNALKAEIITPVFKDEKNGTYKIISFYAKKARGLMANYIIRERIEDIEGLKGFADEGYYFSPKDSTDKELVFLRDVSQEG